MKMKKQTSSGNAMGNAVFPTIGSSKSRKASITDSTIACPLDGRILGLPTSHRIKMTINAEIAQPVTMLLVIAQPFPKSISLDAVGDTPSLSAAKADEAKTKKLSNDVRFFTRNMVQPHTKEV